MKPKVAFFDFAGCEGDQLQVVNLEEQLLDLLAHVDVVEFRESQSTRRETDVRVLADKVERLLKLRPDAPFLWAARANLLRTRAYRGYPTDASLLQQAAEAQIRAAELISAALFVFRRSEFGCRSPRRAACAPQRGAGVNLRLTPASRALRQKVAGRPRFRSGLGGGPHWSIG